MSNSPQEAQPSNWRELDARDNDHIHLEWDPTNNQFRVRVELDDLVGQTPELSFEEAREEYLHPYAAKYLGRVATGRDLMPIPQAA